MVAAKLITVHQAVPIVIGGGMSPSHRLKAHLLRNGKFFNECPCVNGSEWKRRPVQEGVCLRNDE